MAFRALGSALARQALRPAVGSSLVRQPAMASAFKVQAYQPIWRSFAAEAGYLDKDDVTGRVLEVVRKFEKVRTYAGLCFWLRDEVFHIRT